MLLTSGPQFGRTTTPVHLESVKSSKSQSHHTAKLPSRAPSNANTFLDPTEVHMDLIPTNQHTLMANQCNLERIMEKIE